MSRNFLRAGLFFSLMFLFEGRSVLAAAPQLPSTLCVTADSIALNTSKKNQMAKDIFPYLDNKMAQEAIRTYQNTLAIAWAAMEAPYCGYGKEGSRSAKKSYTKTVDRARVAFFANLKKPPTKTVVLSSSTIPSKEIASPALKRVIIPAGLHQGMRSDAVVALQKKLLTYFGKSAASIQTGYFGSQTMDFVIRFQLDRGIVSSRLSEGAGLVGPKTAKALSAL